MAEQEKERYTGLARAAQKAAAAPDGLTLPIAETDEVVLCVAATEVTLYLRPRNEAPKTPAETPVAAAPEPPPGQQEEERRRVTITGNVASVPRYSTLPKKGLRVGFMLAEHDEAGATHYHRVYATGDFARRVQAKNPSRGDTVRVEGERQLNARRQQDGSMKEIEEIYCYGLRITTRPRRASQ